VDECAPKRDVSHSHFRVLAILTEADNQMLPVSELAKKMYISPTNITAIIDKLISHKLVERINDEKDRRVVHIKITPEGCNFLDECKEQMVCLLKENLSPLSEEDLQALSFNLNNVREILVKING
jgi:DNA-binding MarR family transcriptional regulator